MSTATLRTTLDSLEVIRTFTGDADMPAQQITLLLAVALGPGRTMQELANATGVSHSSVSRNVARLGRGIAWDQRGRDLLLVEEDLYDRRHKRVNLTQRGQEMMKKITTTVGPKARLWFTKEA